MKTEIPGEHSPARNRGKEFKVLSAHQNCADLVRVGKIGSPWRTCGARRKNKEGKK